MGKPFSKFACCQMCCGSWPCCPIKKKPYVDFPSQVQDKPINSLERKVPSSAQAQISHEEIQVQVHKAVDIPDKIEQKYGNNRKIESLKLVFQPEKAQVPRIQFYEYNQPMISE